VLPSASADSFNPSRGIAIIQTRACQCLKRVLISFNPSRGIAIIQTVGASLDRERLTWFQSLTRDSNHSNAVRCKAAASAMLFQSLTRDSNHSNCLSTPKLIHVYMFQSLTRDSNHSNFISQGDKRYAVFVSIPHAG